MRRQTPTPTMAEQAESNIASMIESERAKFVSWETMWNRESIRLRRLFVSPTI